MSEDKFQGDSATREMRQVAEEAAIQTVWDREMLQEPHCGFGMPGIC